MCAVTGGLCDVVSVAVVLAGRLSCCTLAGEMNVSFRALESVRSVCTMSAVRMRSEIDDLRGERWKCAIVLGGGGLG